MNHQIRTAPAAAESSRALHSTRNCGQQSGSVEHARNRSLLIVDENTPSIHRFCREMATRGFKPFLANSLKEAQEIAASTPPAFAIVELRLPDGHGLSLVKRLCRSQSDCRVVVLTRMGSIASAVAAVKTGAVDYLAKPADIDEVSDALLPSETTKPSLPEYFMSPDRVRWEHIQRIYELCDHNKSATASKLKMHRRSLQRLLSKDAPL
jgi:two-component system response regulator RegA